MTGEDYLLEELSVRPTQGDGDRSSEPPMLTEAVLRILVARASHPLVQQASVTSH